MLNRIQDALNRSLYDLEIISADCASRLIVSQSVSKPQPLSTLMVARTAGHAKCYLVLYTPYVNERQFGLV